MLKNERNTNKKTKNPLIHLNFSFRYCSTFSLYNNSEFGNAFSMKNKMRQLGTSITIAIALVIFKLKKKKRTNSVIDKR